MLPSGPHPTTLFRLIVTSLLALVPATGLRALDSDYRSPIAVIADREGRSLYVAEETGRRIAEVELASGKVTRAIAVPENPSGLVLAPDGKKLFVTGAAPQGRVQVIALESGKIVAAIPVGHTPLAPQVSPDGKTLYVCNRFNDDISVIDLEAGTQIARIAVVREPVAAVLTPDGTALIVANHLPVGRADADDVSAVVSLIDTASRTVTATVILPNGSTSLRGVCVSPDGAFAYVTHILARYQQPTTQLERGWMNTNALSIVEVKAGKLLATVLLDSGDLGAANPWGITCSADGARLCVAHAGTHEVSVIDRVALHRKIKADTSPDTVADDLAFLVDIRRRVHLSGNGPRGIAMVGERICIAEYFSDSIGIIDLRAATTESAPSWPLGPPIPLTPIRQGERAFHDAQHCFQHWQSCASCHPDARTDGLNWDLLNDGLGNPKNTRSMLLAHQTPPSMSLGIRDSAEMSVRAGFRFIQFTIIEEDVCVAVDKYLLHLKPVPSPWLAADGKPTAQQQRGKALFTSAACALCHVPPLYTNLKQYDLGIVTTGMDQDKPLDTPTLIELWRTAPYLNDGRAATLKDVFSPLGDPAKKHGKGSALKPDELDDLIAYLLTL